MALGRDNARAPRRLPRSSSSAAAAAPTTATSHEIIGGLDERLTLGTAVGDAPVVSPPPLRHAQRFRPACFRYSTGAACKTRPERMITMTLTPRELEEIQRANASGSVR